MNEIKNAKIKATKLGKEDHGILTFSITLEIAGGSGCCYGGFALDDYNSDLKERIPTQRGFEAVTEVLKTVGVENWEDLKGKYIRVEDPGLGRILDKIGNLMEDKWFSLKDHFAEQRKGE